MDEQKSEQYLLQISEKLEANLPLSGEELEYIEKCPECAQFVKMWYGDSERSGVLSSLAQLPFPYVESQQEEIMQAISEEAQTREKRVEPKNVTRMPWLQSAAAVALIGAVVWISMPNQNGADKTVKDHPDTSSETQFSLSERVEKLNQLSLKEEYRSVSNIANNAWDNVTNDVSRATAFFEEKANDITQSIEMLNQAHERNLRKRYDRKTQ